MTVFFLGLLWFFMISMQTRIIAFTNNFMFHGLWTFMVSIVWVFLIKQIIVSTDSWDFILYALGTAVGSIFATYIHSKFMTKKEKD